MKDHILMHFNSDFIYDYHISHEIKCLRLNNAIHTITVPT